MMDMSSESSGSQRERDQRKTLRPEDSQINETRNIKTIHKVIGMTNEKEDQKSELICPVSLDMEEKQKPVVSGPFRNANLKIRAIHNRKKIKIKHDKRRVY